MAHDAAQVMAVEVEHKVASANVFAEQVGVEKEKVNAENGAPAAPAWQRGAAAGQGLATCHVSV
jgi:hypothetical protein